MSTTPPITTTERAIALLTILLGDDRLTRAQGFARWVESLFPRRGQRPALRLLEALSSEPAAVADATDYPVRALSCALSDNKVTAAKARDGSGTALGYFTAWAARGRQGTMVLASPTGRGKTVAAVWACLEQGDGARFVRCPTLGELGFDQAAQGLLRQLSRVRFLVLDELGREAAYGPTPGRIADLIGDRHDKGLPTMITTNLVPRHDDQALSFGQRYGVHLLDRIEHGGGFWAPVGGESLRNSPPPDHTDATRQCRVAELVRRVAVGRDYDHPRLPSDVGELANCFDITDEAIVAEAIERRRWLAEGKVRLRTMTDAYVAKCRAVFDEGETVNA